MDLYWKQSDDPKVQTLHVGVFGIVIGWMKKANKHYEGFLELPQLELSRRYAPENEMRALMSAAVTDWFAKANTHRPAVDNEVE